MVAYHNGDLGDVVYAIPAMLQLGITRCYLGPTQMSKIVARNGIPAELFEVIAPLLQHCGIAAQFSAIPPFVDVDFSNVRMPYSDPRTQAQLLEYGGWPPNLCAMHSVAFGHKPWSATKPWIPSVDPWSVAPVIVTKTERYQNSTFRWEDVVENFRGQLCFLGLRSEWEQFCSKHGRIPWYPTKTLLEAASVVAGARLFVTNQSSLHAVAEGLKFSPTVLVECDTPKETADVRFERPGKWNYMNPGDLKADWKEFL